MTVTWPILLLSCGRQPTASAPPGAAADTAAPEAAAALPEPGRTADEVAAEISALLQRTPPDPITVNNDAFVWIMGQGDGQCPGDLSFRIGDCTAGTDWRFFGIADYFEEIDGDDWWASLELGDMLITDPDGSVSLIGGTYEIDRGDSRFSGEVTGTFQIPALGGWFETGSFAWWLDAELRAGAERLEVAGALGAADGAGLHFEDVVFGGDCGDAPTGALQLRDRSGRWYRVELADSCDGCGSLTYAEQVDMGEVCLDTGAFFADTIARLQAPPAHLSF